MVSLVRLTYCHYLEVVLLVIRGVGSNHHFLDGVVRFKWTVNDSEHRNRTYVSLFGIHSHVKLGQVRA